MALSVDVTCWLREQLLPKACSEEKLILKNAWLKVLETRLPYCW